MGKIAELGIGTAQSQPVSQEKLAGVVQGWQPIATAPENVEIFALVPWGSILEADIVRLYPNGEWYSYRDHEDFTASRLPRYWMPIPEAPSDSQTDTKPAGVHPPARVTHLGAE